MRMKTTELTTTGERLREVAEPHKLKTDLAALVKPYFGPFPDWLPELPIETIAACQLRLVALLTDPGRAVNGYSVLDALSSDSDDD